MKPPGVDTAAISRSPNDVKTAARLVPKAIPVVKEKAPEIAKAAIDAVRIIIRK